MIARDSNLSRFLITADKLYLKFYCTAMFQYFEVKIHSEISIISLFIAKVTQLFFICRKLIRKTK